MSAAKAHMSVGTCSGQVKSVETTSGAASLCQTCVVHLYTGCFTFTQDPALLDEAPEGSALTFLYFFPWGSFAKTLQELPF